MSTKSICLNTRRKNSFRMLLDRSTVIDQMCKETAEPGSKLLIMIPNWKGIRPYQDNFFYWDPTFHLKEHRYIYGHATRHSKKVVRAAKNFMTHLGLTPPILGIHIRLERLLKADTNKEHLQKCLDRMEVLINSLLEGGRARSAIAFRDYGRHGSSTCHKMRCSWYAKEMQLDKRLQKLGVKVQEYDLEPRQENGFISNVEQEVLAQSNMLLMVGYGSFQMGVVERFKRYKEQRRSQDMWIEQDTIHRICEQYKPGSDKG